MIWTIAAMAAQLRTARGGGRREYSRPQGSPGRGLAYFMTIAMLPAHKESVRHHPVEFAVGMIFHLGLLCALAGIVMLVINPALGTVWCHGVWPVLVVALAAGLVLFVRRLASKYLRFMSSPDDYLAVLASCGLLAVTGLIALDRRVPLVALLYASLLFIYMPLGKLRHAAFFFAARADQGRRLGYRGVYPPAPQVE
jgi:hypothetical protein